MNILKRSSKNIYTMLYWSLMAALVGVVTGVVGALFHHAISFAAHLRQENGFLIYFLPLGGVAIAFLYRLSKEPLSTNTVIDCIRKSETASALMAPLIFAGTFITHLLGGSAGREGAALQIGGGIGSRIAHRLSMTKEQSGVMIACGMSGAFTAIFTTPVTATVFALELVSVGHIRYFQMLPCVISSLIGYIITVAMGNEPLFYMVSDIPKADLLSLLGVIALGILCALLSVVFCKTLHKSEQLLKKYIKRDYIRSLLGGCAIVALSLLVGNGDYNGAGMDVIERALSGDAFYGAFILKIIFTAITIGAGFKGGEIVPAFFVGATFGAVAGPLLGLSASFSASVALVCVFCGVTNCPLASVILGTELFGAQGLLFYALGCAITFVVSDRVGLYSSQKIVYSHTSAQKNIHYVE